MHEQTDRVTAAVTAYNFDPYRVIVVGYSNGVSIAAGQLLCRSRRP
jgi:predicted esterase